MDLTRIISILNAGGIILFPTETVYGLGALATNDAAVQKIFEVKGRPTKNPLILHIAENSQLQGLVEKIPEAAKKLMEKFWPGKVSIILPFHNKELSYLDRMGGTLAFRFPDKKDLIDILKESGPIVAPSANPERRASQPAKAQQPRAA